MAVSKQKKLGRPFVLILFGELLCYVVSSYSVSNLETVVFVVVAVDFQSPDVTVNEEDGNATVCVTRNATTEEAMNVTVTTNFGSADSKPLTFGECEGSCICVKCECASGLYFFFFPCPICKLIKSWLGIL